MYNQPYANVPSKSILLVGGFGSSEYLFMRLKNKYADVLSTKDNPDVVLQPVDSWTAVVRGAVIRGMETIVQTRKSRYHYGVKYWEYFDENIHSEEHKYWDTTREKWLAENQIKWYIAKVCCVGVVSKVMGLIFCRGRKCPRTRVYLSRFILPSKTTTAGCLWTN